MEGREKGEGREKEGQRGGEGPRGRKWGRTGGRAKGVKNRGSVLQAIVPNSATHIYRENDLTFDISINKLSDHNFDPCTITGKYS